MLYCRTLDVTLDLKDPQYPDHDLGTLELSVTLSPKEGDMRDAVRNSCKITHLLIFVSYKYTPPHICQTQKWNRNVLSDTIFPNTHTLKKGPTRLHNMSINLLYNCIHPSSAAVLFSVSKEILQTSEAQSCCVPLERVGSSPPRLLESLQLSKCICINTSAINMFNGKVTCSKSTGFSSLITLAQTSTGILCVPQLHLFPLNYLFG